MCHPLNADDVSYDTAVAVDAGDWPAGTPASMEGAADQHVDARGQAYSGRNCQMSLCEVSVADVVVDGVDNDYEEQG